MDVLCQTKEKGYGILHYACEKGISKAVAFVGKCTPETRRKALTAKSIDGLYPIQVSASYEYPFASMVTMMKKEGLSSELLYKNPRNGDSLMHLLCRNGWKESDGLLDALESKEDKISLLTSPNLEGVTPLVKSAYLFCMSPLPIRFTAFS